MLAVLQEQDIQVIPMPHTSPLTWNRNATDGQKWTEVGRQQVQVVVQFLHGCREEKNECQ